jgi:hypothetical protein
MASEAKKSKKEEVKNVLSSGETLFDAETESEILRFIEGSGIPTIISDLKAANLTNEQKASLSRVSVLAAISVRRNLAEILKADLSVVSSLPFMVLNSKVNMGKLSIIGHCLMRYEVTGKIGEAWRAKLNGKLSIFETSDYSKFPVARAEIFEALKSRSLFTKDFSDTLFKLVIPAKAQ